MNLFGILLITSICLVVWADETANSTTKVKRQYQYARPNGYYVDPARRNFDANAEIINQFDQRSPNGDFDYGYELSNGVKVRQTTVTINGERVTTGYYSYIDNGKTYTVHYVADRNGYRASGEHLPAQPLPVRPLRPVIGYNPSSTPAPFNPPSYPSSTPIPFGPSYSSSSNPYQPQYASSTPIPFGPSYSTSSSPYRPSYPSTTYRPPYSSSTYRPSFPTSTPAPFRPSFPFAPLFSSSPFQSTTPIPIISTLFPNLNPNNNNNNNFGRPPPTSIYVPSSTPFNRPVPSGSYLPPSSTPFPGQQPSYTPFNGYPYPSARPPFPNFQPFNNYNNNFNNNYDNNNYNNNQTPAPVIYSPTPQPFPSSSSLPPALNAIVSFIQRRPFADDYSRTTTNAPPLIRDTPTSTISTVLDEDATPALRARFNAPNDFGSSTPRPYNNDLVTPQYQQSDTVYITPKTYYNSQLPDSPFINRNLSPPHLQVDPLDNSFRRADFEVSGPPVRPLHANEYKKRYI